MEKSHSFERGNGMGDDKVSFGRSQFRGKTGIRVAVHRWIIQFAALTLKNFVILSRRSLHLFSFLILPSVVFLPFLVEMQSNHSSDNSQPLQPSIPINGLGQCDAYHSSQCVRVAYGPMTELTGAIMETFSSTNGLIMPRDVIGFSSEETAQQYVTEHLGTVQFTIFFRDMSLWETVEYSPSGSALPKNMSYVMFYNDTSSKDARSKDYGINFPLLVLQKELEAAYLKVVYGAQYTPYNVQYGQLWAVPAPPVSEQFDATASPNASSSSTAATSPCDWGQRTHMNALGSIAPWVISFAFLLLGNVAFQVVAEERHKNLFNYLRRVGLFDSAYWASWFFVFQVFLVAACIISMIVAVIVRTHSSALRAVDLGLMFLLLYLSGTAFVALAFLLATFCSSSSVSAALTFSEFLICLITISLCSDALNYYSWMQVTDSYGTVLGVECHLVASSFNKIFSSSLTGNEFVKFLVFFLPWFHSSQALSDIISTVQYVGQSQGAGGLSTPVQMTYSSSGSSALFRSKGIGWSFTMLGVEVIIFIVLAWLSAQFFTSDGSEGRSVLSVLIPPFVKDLFMKKEEILLGDVRGLEKEQSRIDQSIRVYKVSKTYSGVQALKEVSFSLPKGELFVLLGHNGAGKSTLINVITGLIAPTHGKVFLNGLDIEQDVTEVQQTIGVCPQDDLLWDDLTAREHILLTAAFKGCMLSTDLLHMADAALDAVRLKHRGDDFARHFSGGMKRRLSVAMSTIGDVDLLFLDEPTTGLDPMSRRRVWEAINLLKKDRIVILTTHNMEEADFLADTIMVMHNGQVRAWGDPLYLKDTYGKGYRVNLSVSSENIDRVKAMIGDILPNPSITMGDSAVQLSSASMPTRSGDVGGGGEGGEGHRDTGTASDGRFAVRMLPAGILAGGRTIERKGAAGESSGSTMTVTVPRSDIQGLPRLFAWLEHSDLAHSLVREWGVSNTTLGQVFLSLCEQNSQVNYSAVQKENDLMNMHNVCPMCRRNPKELVFLRSLVNGRAMIVDDSLCGVCANGNPHYEVDEEIVRHALVDLPVADLPAQKARLLQEARTRSDASAMKRLLNAEQQLILGAASEDTTAAAAVFDESEWTGGGSLSSMRIASTAGVIPQSASEVEHRGGRVSSESSADYSHVLTEERESQNTSEEGAYETLARSPQPSRTPIASAARNVLLEASTSQIKAILFKNIVLQSRQNCSNCCR